MSSIVIEWLTATSDCDEAGCSGGYSEGARVHKDGEEWFELRPTAHCFGGDSWGQEDVFREILKRLGHVVHFQYGDV